MSGQPGKGRLAGIPNGYPAWERIMRRTIKQDDGCWIWQGATDSKSGHGKIGWRKSGISTMLYTHRVITSWYWLGKDGDFIPKFCDSFWGYKIDKPFRLHVHHECEVPRCVNPDHLFIMSAGGHALIGHGEPAGNAEKTECPHGHGPYDKQYKNGHRYCSKCKAEKEKRRRQKILEEGKVAKAKSTHCYQGHEYDIFKPTGPRCSICQKQRRKEYRMRTGK